MSKVLIVDKIFHTYGGTSSKLALNETSLTLSKNEIVSLVGPSGCGKSTLLHIIAGLIKATSGHVQCLGKEVIAQGLARFKAYVWSSVVAHNLALFSSRLVPT